MRNILLIHLESLNHMLYQMNKNLFVTLQKWERRSISFSKYFSTATSTLMVMSDLAYGGMLQNEPCDSLVDKLRKCCYQESLLDRLKKSGYQVKAAIYPMDGSDDVTGSNQRHFVGYTVEIKEMESYQTYMSFLGGAITKEKPFAVWACNVISNIGCNSSIENIGSQTGLERWESGYLYMDQYVHDMMDILERNNLLEQTTVVFYGDHGDDLFAHGKHSGLTHAIEPYETLIHTPFWIYDSRFAPTQIDVLIDTTDIKGIAEQLLNLPDEKMMINVLNLPSRRYSLARNVYAAQKVREKTFHKAYSLTDGRFLFLVGNQGMELYHIGMDALCQHNLLDYFDFDGSVLSLNTAAYEAMGYHFSCLIDGAALLQIEQVFYEYRNQMINEVKKIYEYAECRRLSVEIRFDFIHYGWEERKRRQDAETKIMDSEVESQGEFSYYRRYLEGKRIILYGAGKYGKFFYEKMLNSVKIVAWVDGNYENMQSILGQKIQSPDCIIDLEFDIVFIAIMSVKERQKIKNKLIQIGVSVGKIFN